jgi:hypothetical protein
LGEAASLDAQLQNTRSALAQDGFKAKRDEKTLLEETRDAVLRKIRETAESTTPQPDGWAAKDGIALLKQLDASNSKTVSPFEDPSFLTSQVTRISVVIIIFFAVQLLVGIYRYNTRLAAFYFAQADAVLMMDRPVVAVEMASGLTPGEVDFTKGPQTPMGTMKDVLLAATRMGGRGGTR